VAVKCLIYKLSKKLKKKKQQQKQITPLFEGRIIFVCLFDSTQLNDGHKKNTICAYIHAV